MTNSISHAIAKCNTFTHNNTLLRHTLLHARSTTTVLDQKIFLERVAIPPPHDTSATSTSESYAEGVTPLLHLVPIPSPDDKSATSTFSSFEAIQPPTALSVTSDTSSLSAASTFEPFATNFSEYVNATGLQLACMVENRSKHWFEKILNDEEQEEWDDIERAVDGYVREVKWFAQYTKEKYELIKRRVGNQNFMSLNECYEGFDATETAAKMDELKKQGHKIIEDVEKFRKKTENV